MTTRDVALKSWRDFLTLNEKNKPNNIATPSWADAKTFKRVEARVMELRDSGELKELGLSEGEAAAVLLCTMGDELFQAMQGALLKERVKASEEEAKRYGSLAATLVSALRKLRAKRIDEKAHHGDVNFVFVSDVQSLTHVEGKPFYVANPFVFGTTVVPLGGHKTGYILSPYKMSAALIPPCLCKSPEDNIVLFEPGATFEKVMNVYFFTQLEPAKEDKNLLFPSYTYFPPLKMAS